jgi:AcrR family transcriptional regulator
MIVDTAARLATVEGLSGLSLGRLAEATGMSKSGVFGLFGSKEELQLATIDKAREVFITEVVHPALAVPVGLERLRSLCDGYLDYLRRRVFPGGCFFASVAAEVSATPGPVRDRIASEQGRWVGLLGDNARHAQDARELADDVDPDRLALELSALLTGADIAFLLHENVRILDGIRAAIHARLDSLSG